MASARTSSNLGIRYFPSLAILALLSFIVTLKAGGLSANRSGSNPLEPDELEALLVTKLYNVVV